MFIADFSTEAYLVRGKRVRAIGWLDSGHPFTRGPVAEGFLHAFKAHVAAVYQPVIFLGWHDCNFCPVPAADADDDEFIPGRQGTRNILVPTAELLYVA